jgi:hypothetical protein
MSHIENEPGITSTKTSKQTDAIMYIVLGAVLVAVLVFSFVAITLGGGAKDARPITEYPSPTSAYRESNDTTNSVVMPRTNEEVSNEFSNKTTVQTASEKNTTAPVQKSPILESMSSVPCNDTDGGKFPNKYGETTGASRTGVVDPDGTRRYVDGTVRTVKDLCVAAGGTTVYQGENVFKEVNEGFCGDDGRLTIHGVPCPLGCRDGACIVEHVKPTAWLRADGQDEMVRKEYGTTVTLTWGSTLAETCSVKSNGVATEAWNASTIPLSGTKKLIVNNTITSTDFTISCTSSTGHTVKDVVRVYSQREV